MKFYIHVYLYKILMPMEALSDGHKCLTFVSHMFQDIHDLLTIIWQSYFFYFHEVLYCNS